MRTRIVNSSVICAVNRPSLRCTRRTAPARIGILDRRHEPREEPDAEEQASADMGDDDVVGDDPVTEADVGGLDRVEEGVALEREGDALREQRKPEVDTQKIEPQVTVRVEPAAQTFELLHDALLPPLQVCASRGKPAGLSRSNHLHGRAACRSRAEALGVDPVEVAVDGLVHAVGVGDRREVTGARQDLDGDVGQGPREQPRDAPRRRR